MAKFQYKALKNKTEFVEGEVEATSLREARQKIIALGFLPTKVYTEFMPADQNYSNTVAPISDSQVVVRRLSLNEKIWFTTELQTLLGAGISVLEALESVEKTSAGLKVKSVCKTLRQSILSGNTFAQSMEKYYSKVFGQVYIGLVKAGEDSGALDETLARMLVILNKEAKVLDKIKSASIYPCLLIALMLGVIMLFSVVVFPRLMGVVAFSGGEAPFFAKTVFGFCTFVQHFWWLIIIFIVGGLTGFSMLLKTYAFKKGIDKFILEVPKLSEFISYINLANYMTVLYISYEAGVPIVLALELALKTVGNIQIKTKLSNVAYLVKSGQSLTYSLSSSQVVPAALMSMVSTGEQSGSLGKMLKEAADVIDKKVDFVLEALSKCFEPIIIIIMGLCVGALLVAFMQMYASALTSLF